MAKRTSARKIGPSRKFTSNGKKVFGLCIVCPFLFLSVLARFPIITICSERVKLSLAFFPIRHYTGYNRFPQRKENTDMHLYFSGGAMEIGGSCIYIRLSGRKLLLDCGIRQSAAKDPLPDFRTIQEQGGVDAILISHAHMDHIGALPIISRAYPDAPIYMTLMTGVLTRVLVYDCL